VQMAVEASVAQLLRTGFVHADPHEGNMLYTHDGRLAYLDFGLMCTVQPAIMEGTHPTTHPAMACMGALIRRARALLRCPKRISATTNRPRSDCV
jgi:hypothetical protein